MFLYPEFIPRKDAFTFKSIFICLIVFVTQVLLPCWIHYKSGILTSEICGPSTGLDHFMTLVGFHHARASDIIGAGDELEYNRTCRWATEEERGVGSC